MRLTAELIDKSTSFLNALKERELDLRGKAGRRHTQTTGNKIPALENLAVTRDQYDTIDLTDNDLRKLDNFPSMRRLRTLLASNNQISKLDNGAELGVKLPRLEMLVLNNNAISEFGELQPLCAFKNLRYLSLIDCPVTRKAHYRLTVVKMLPQLRALDFRKITLSERTAASSMFGEKHPTATTTDSEIQPPPSKTRRVESERIAEAIKNATSLEEIKQMEKILATGHVPGL